MDKPSRSVERGTPFILTQPEDGYEAGTVIYMQYDDDTDCPYFTTSINKYEGSEAKWDLCTSWGSIEPYKVGAGSALLNNLISQMEAEHSRLKAAEVDLRAEAREVSEESAMLTGVITALKGL